MDTRPINAGCGSLNTGSEQSAANGTSGAGALAKLLGQLNLPTLSLIVLMGGGNLWATKSVSEEQRLDIFRAVRQIHELHDALEQFEGRQKQSLEGNAVLLRNQIQMLDNQTRMLQELKGKQ